MKFIQSWWDIDNKKALSDTETKLTELSRMTLEHNLNAKITFYTDLKNTNGLNYSNILPLNVAGLPKELWCLGKLAAIALQNEPFAHIDTDVFLWSKTEHDKFKKPFIVLHHENWVQQFMNFARQVPAPGRLGKDYELFNSNNFGIVGGTEWRLIKESAQEILEHIKKYGEEIVNIAKQHETGDRLMWTPVLVEQVWLSEILRTRDIHPSSYLGDENRRFNAFYEPKLSERAEKLGIAHFWSNTKKEHEKELLHAHSVWSNYLSRVK